MHTQYTCRECSSPHHGEVVITSLKLERELAPGTRPTALDPRWFRDEKSTYCMGCGLITVAAWPKRHPMPAHQPTGE